MDASHVGVIAHGAGDTNGVLVAAWRRLGIDARLLTPTQAGRALESGDTALVRIDVRESLDGMEPGLDAVRELMARGCRVLNSESSLVAVHDKLMTARLLQGAEIPHPRTMQLSGVNAELPLRFPVVVKPRFGSWGRDVYKCESQRQFDEHLPEIATQSWFHTGGGIVQELIPPKGFDLRLLVAGDTIVGAAWRVAARGNWRTNVSLGGRLLPAVADRAARELGLRAAGVTGIDLAAIDLLPSGDGWIVLELNGAASFDNTYARPGDDVFAEIACSLGLGERRTDRFGHPSTEAVR